MDDDPVRPLVPRPKGLLPAPYPSAQALPSPSTPRSIMKTSDSALVGKPEPSASITQSSTPSSPSKSIRKKTAPPYDPGRRTPARTVEEGAFFAFVLLPLSCWYTRGGKRLKEMDDFDDEPFRPRSSQQLQRRSSVSVAVPMKSLGLGRW